MTTYKEFELILSKIEEGEVLNGHQREQVGRILNGDKFEIKAWRDFLQWIGERK